MSHFHYNSDISTSVIVIVQFLFFVISETFFKVPQTDTDIFPDTDTVVATTSRARKFCHNCFRLQVYYTPKPKIDSKGGPSMCAANCNYFFFLEFTTKLYTITMKSKLTIIFQISFRSPSCFRTTRRLPFPPFIPTGSCITNCN